ncbi:hypothetical protein J2045_003322 [Peteryoungia aggregata LMG 23059]|uniref:Uncharacterized protein n=1 Tax=Peteryoungia aggregata LMG 23059 TaxID=1368425 RepID=A0ABU0GBH1_9HYPH|nr:hypothetical protein [Peteryoungia aggregata]MDQ0422274.1 hypothetical protein [Peteryoungia aggregata LMG 23059]
MSVHARIILFIIAGWLYGSGWISEEVKNMLTTDPEVAAYVQGLIAALTIAVGYVWRWLAKKVGWST